MKDVLNIISFLFTIIVVYGVIYFILNNTIGRIYLFRREQSLLGISMKDVILTFIAGALIVFLMSSRVINIYSPW